MQNVMLKYLNRGVSQSALSLFRNCPYAFQLRYINKCKPVFYDESVLDVGGYVHDSIDGYYKHHYELVQDSETILYYSYQLLKNQWDTLLKPEQFQQAYECLFNHSNWEYGQQQKGVITQPLTEQELSYGGYFGIIDYIDLLKNNVIDWKTGKNAYLSYEYRMQAYIYKVIYEGNFNKKLDKFLFYFLFPNEFRMVSYNKEKQIKVAEETEKLKRDLYDAVESMNFEKKPRTPKGCRSCSFVYYCHGNK